MTIKFNSSYIKDYYSLLGKNEHGITVKGDLLIDDYYYEKKSVEEAESEYVKKCVQGLLNKSKLKEKDKTKAIDEFLINLENEIENILIELRKNFIVRDNDVKLDLHKVWASKVLQEYDMETINRMNSLLNECFGIIQTKQPQEKGFQRKKLYKIKKK